VHQPNGVRAAGGIRLTACQRNRVQAKIAYLRTGPLTLPPFWLAHSDWTRLRDQVAQPDVTHIAERHPLAVWLLGFHALAEDSSAAVVRQDLVRHDFEALENLFLRPPLLNDGQPCV
jgi:hypothetical protein